MRYGFRRNGREPEPASISATVCSAWALVANINTTDNEAKTPLRWAAANRNKDVAELRRQPASPASPPPAISTFGILNSSIPN